MAFLSTADLIARVIRALHQVQGAGTQLYSETLIADKLRETYDEVRNERWWDHLMHWTQRTLDGATGRFTTPISGMQSTLDFRVIRSSGGDLPWLAGDLDPFRLTGVSPRFVEYTSEPGYWCRVWPLTATGVLSINYRADPVGIFTNPQVIVPFDDTVLINGAAAKLAAADGANAAHLTMLMNVFNTRLDQLRRMQSTRQIMMDPRYNVIPDQWYEHSP